MVLKLSKIAGKIVAILLFCFVWMLANTPGISTLSGSEFNAGNIINDGTFFTPEAMDIQGFLNSQVPSCDTNGDKMIYDPAHGDTVTRRTYSERRGNYPPFICLKDYRQDVPARAAETALCNGIGAGNKSASQIIYEASQSCGINPRVLTVLLQKEQSLVTDDWPWQIQYRAATGYGCPDGAPCDAEYYGFFNQVYNAARQFKLYKRSPSSFNYRAGRNNTIAWHPNSACGTSEVFIENQATAGLYNYTPYRPNQAALNNLYGTGDSCSSYGNRNFWRLYNDWFNTLPEAENTPIGPIAYRLSRPPIYDHYFPAREGARTFAKQYMGFKDDNTALLVKPDDNDGAEPVYELYNGRLSDYFYVLDGPDRYWAIVHGGYKEEGIAFYAYRTQLAGTIPVTRLWHGGRGDHFYTTSGQDIYYCQIYDGYTSDGVVFYAVEP